MPTTQSTQAQTQNQNTTVISNSDFSYEPPQVTDETAEFNQALKDIIGEIESEYAPEPEFENEPPQDGTQEQPSSDAEGAGEPGADAGTEAAQPAQDKEDPAVLRGLDRLVQRETALQAREASLQARETKAAALEARIKELEGRLPEGNVVDMVAYDPEAALKAMGHDPDRVINLAIAKKLKAQGKPIPDALKEALIEADMTARDRESKARIDALERQLKEKTSAEQSAAYFNAVALGAREYVKGFSDPKMTTVLSKKMPVLADLVKSDPDRVHSEILGEITRDARERAASDPNGEPMTYEQAAANVEARFAGLKAILVPTNAPANKQAKAPGAAPVKPPTKPIRPWEAKNDLEQQGLNEAMREFYKLESQRKAKR